MNVLEDPTRPLYQQVRDELMQRLIDGRWQPGMLLPSEQRLCAELGVSQGTIRKAIDGLVADRLLLRRQGRGTFVSSQEEGHFLFKFFRMRRDDGQRHLPSSRFGSCRRTKPDAETAELLRLGQGDRIWSVERVRTVDERPVIYERIMLPTKRFPDLNLMQPLPNNIYALFASRYGITVRSAFEKLKATLAASPEAERLECQTGTPVLQIDRIAYGLDEAPVERRSSYCLTDELHYESTLT